ncbi:MAG: lipopolysaccharide assembly protein LapB, partial [Brachymonas sp.]|nr:lipopolysaccharide assembly protein LapB [Brachymonas sp.]
FRRRGEYDRAVRVHEHLMARGDLSKADHQRAQHALALDYLKAGLLDRAEDALGKLEGTKFETEARLARLAIFERTRDWAAAQQVAQQLQASSKSSNLGSSGDFSIRLSHYLCEQAEGAAIEERSLLLQQAMAAAPQAARPAMMLAALQESGGEPDLALNTLLDGIKSAPIAIPLIANKLVQLGLQCQRIEPVQAALQAFYAQTHSLDALQALNHLQAASGANDSSLLLAHLRDEPSLVITAQLMKSSAETAPDIQRALDKAAGPLLRYRCAACGFEASRHFWQCPGCQSWDSYSTRRVEEL